MIVRINLLPKEIKEKRNAERLIFAGFTGLVIVVAMLGCLFAYNAWKIKNAETELAMLQEQTVKMNSAIQTMRVYEVRLQEVDKKKGIVDKALTDRIIWSKLLEELMIITPNEVSLNTITGNADGVTFTGGIRDTAELPDSGHKPVAKWLIRLSELKLQPDVWLSSSDKQEGLIVFSNNMKFKKTPTPPAPPAPSGTPTGTPAGTQ